MENDSELFDEDDSNVENTFLTFHVEGGEYAVSVGYVTEIVRLQKMFAMPDVPEYIRGVINLRGKVIPLLDVRNRFGLPEAPYTDRTVIVVLESRRDFNRARGGWRLRGSRDFGRTNRAGLTEQDTLGQINGERHGETSERGEFHLGRELPAGSETRIGVRDERSRRVSVGARQRQPAPFAAASARGSGEQLR